MNIPDEKIKQILEALQDGAVKGSIECHEIALDLHYMVKSDMVELEPGIGVPSAIKELIDNYLKNDCIIKAIKVFRRYNGLGLLEAKNIIERYRDAEIKKEKDYYTLYDRADNPE